MSLNKSLKVLLVEDEKIAAVVHSKMLEGLGYRPDVAENCQEALTLAANNYDVILMDVGLPDISGIDIAAKIRQSEGSRWAYIVGVTGYMREEVEAQCLMAGMEEVITKPLSVEKLCQLLTKASENKKKHTC
jgi:CheY-like chemotaxis protein